MVQIFFKYTQQSQHKLTFAQKQDTSHQFVDQVKNKTTIISISTTTNNKLDTTEISKKIKDMKETEPQEALHEEKTMDPEAALYVRELDDQWNKINFITPKKLKTPKL